MINPYYIEAAHERRVTSVGQSAEDPNLLGLQGIDLSWSIGMCARVAWQGNVREDLTRQTGVVPYSALREETLPAIKANVGVMVKSPADLDTLTPPPVDRITAVFATVGHLPIDLFNEEYPSRRVEPLERRLATGEALLDFWADLNLLTSSNTRIATAAELQLYMAGQIASGLHQLWQDGESS
jgi:hypothetical protein